MKYILGSGIIGLLAKQILGPEWTIIPFYKSRFFSFNPALDDNYIIRDDDIDPFFQEHYRSNVLLYKRAYSIGGQLIGDYNKQYTDAWLDKFIPNKPNQSLAYMNDRLNMFIYDLRINEIYSSLQKQYAGEIQEQAEIGSPVRITDHKLIFRGRTIDYDQIVSTIPLDALYKLTGNQSNLISKPVHYLHVETEDLDLENNNQVLVVDNYIDFYKVTNIAKNKYLFYCHRDIQNPGMYLMNFIKRFDIIDGTVIEDAICCGSTPDMQGLESNDIFCVGSYAQWDWCMDVGSCVKRLLRLAKNEFKTQPKRVYKGR
jgi:hypothetical protein